MKRSRAISNLVCYQGQWMTVNDMKLSLAYKIGKSHDPIKRFTALSVANTTIELIMVINRNVELALHRKYEHKHSQGEWYKLSEDDLIDINFEYKSTNV